MACSKKQAVGFCGHPQCPFPHETEHGYECVDIISGFCEVGEDCLSKCSFSWVANTPRAEEAYAAFELEFAAELSDVGICRDA